MSKDLNLFKKEVFKDFASVVLRIIKERFEEDAVLIFENLYDKHFGRLAAIMDNQGDPTSPTKLKPAVLAYVRQQAVLTSANLPSSSKSIKNIRLKFFDESAVGPSEPSSGETDYLRLFFFYLYGVAGEFCFISEDTYGSINPSREDAWLGRFGRGFMMEKSVYNNIREKRARGGTKMPPFETIKSPVSGTPPSSILNELEQEVFLLLQKYVSVGIDKFLSR